ncbi:MAG: hypothetical protein ACO1QB_03010 [Verrucomicrobiales bacterium]
MNANTGGVDPEGELARIAADATNMGTPDKSISEPGATDQPKRKAGQNRDLRDIDEVTPKRD